MHAQRKLKIGELPVQDGLLTQEQVTFVLEQQTARPEATPFGELHIELGLVSPAIFGRVLRRHHHRLSLDELLIHLGLVSQDQVEVALKQPKGTKKKLGALLVEQEVLNQTALVKALYQQAQTTRRTASRWDELVSTQRLTQENLPAATREAKKTRQSVEAVLIDHYDIIKPEMGKVLSTVYSCLFVEYSQQAEIDPSLTRNLDSKYLKANYWIPLTATATAESVEVLIDDPHSFQKFQDIRRHLDASERRNDPNEAIASLSNILDQLEEEAEVAVGNYGVSIREAELETIFDKFVQSSKTKTGGGGARDSAYRLVKRFSLLIMGISGHRISPRAVCAFFSASCWPNQRTH